MYDRDPSDVSNKHRQDFQCENKTTRDLVLSLLLLFCGFSSFGIIDNVHKLYHWGKIISTVLYRVILAHPPPLLISNNITTYRLDHIMFDFTSGPPHRSSRRSCDSRAAASPSRTLSIQSALGGIEALLFEDGSRGGRRARFRTYYRAGHWNGRFAGPDRIDLLVFFFFLYRLLFFTTEPVSSELVVIRISLAIAADSSESWHLRLKRMLCDRITVINYVIMYVYCTSSSLTTPQFHVY